METAYLISAIIGSTLLLCQFLFTVLGIGDDDGGGDHDADGGHDHGGHHGLHGGNWFVGVLTFRTVVAALAFFGLAGLAGSAKGLAPPLTLAVAIAAGVAIMFVIAFLMRSLHRLNADGSVRIEKAVGQPGVVYLRIPGHKAGAGKVHLNLQNRTVECQAVTAHDELATGSAVVVVAVVNHDTVEVAPTSVRQKDPIHA
jgi:membrane protein implicated in regulation of membrane protease activity